MKLSDTIDKRESWLAALGMLSAFTLGLTVIGLGVYLAASHNMEIGGSILGAGGLGSLLYVFVYGSRKQKRNVETFVLDSPTDSDDDAKTARQRSELKDS